MAYFSVLLFSCGLEQAESQTTLCVAGDSSNSSNNSKMNVMTSAYVKRLYQFQELRLTRGGLAETQYYSPSPSMLFHTGRLAKTGFDGLPCILAFSENVLFRVNYPKYPRSH